MELPVIRNYNEWSRIGCSIRWDRDAQAQTQSAEASCDCTWKAEHGDPLLVAENAVYRGSPEHKDYPSPAGNPLLRSDASKCDPCYTEFESITEVLRVGIRRGCVGAIFEGGFPKYVWGWLDGRLYEARHINGPRGSYKAYPLEEIEYPIDPEARLVWGPNNA